MNYDTFVVVVFVFFGIVGICAVTALGFAIVLAVTEIFRSLRDYRQRKK